MLEVADLQPGLAHSFPGDIGVAGFDMPFFEYRDELYFNALGPQGKELYMTDGETISVVADVSPDFFRGPNASNFRVLRGELYFTGRGPSGVDLYKTDGETITSLDVNPDFAAFDISIAHRTQYAEFGGHLLFEAFGPNGDGLFATDGTTISEVTIPHRVTNPNLSGAVEFNGALYFGAEGPNGAGLYSLTVAIPDPATWILLLVGGLLALVRCAYA